MQIMIHLKQNTDHVGHRLLFRSKELSEHDTENILACEESWAGNLETADVAL